MNRLESIISRLGEECSEVIQMTSKSNLFGLDEVYQVQALTNGERLLDEIHDLISVAMMLEEEGALGPVIPTRARYLQKKAKVEKYLAYQRTIGKLDE